MALCVQDMILEFIVSSPTIPSNPTALVDQTNLNTRFEHRGIRDLHLVKLDRSNKCISWQVHGAARPLLRAFGMAFLR